MSIRIIAKWLGIFWMGITAIGVISALGAFFFGVVNSRLSAAQNISEFLLALLVSTSIHAGLGYLLYRWGKKGEALIPPNQKQSEGVNFFLVLGILIMSLSGLCSGVFILTSLKELARSLDLLVAVAVFGGIPFSIGFGIYFVARKFRRKAEQPKN